MFFVRNFFFGSNLLDDFVRRSRSTECTKCVKKGTEISNKPSTISGGLFSRFRYCHRTSDSIILKATVYAVPSFDLSLIIDVGKALNQQERAMRYPIAIEPGNDTTAFGIVFPDLPGCFSAGDTLDEAIAGAEQAAAAWIDAAFDSGDMVPKPTSIAHVRANNEFEGWTFRVISVVRRRAPKGLSTNNP